MSLRRYLRTTGQASCVLSKPRFSETNCHGSMHLDAEFFPFINSLMVILRSHDSSIWCLIVFILERPFSYLISISVFDTITCVCLTWKMKMMTRVCILYKKCICCHLLKRFFEWTNLKDIQFPEMNISLPLTLENPLNLKKLFALAPVSAIYRFLKNDKKQNMTSSLQNQRAVFLQIKTYWI